MTNDQDRHLPPRAWAALGGWPTLAVFAAVAVAAVAVRCLEAPQWSDPRYMVHGEHIMASHDAYAWMAGALGYSRYAAEPLSHFVALVHAVTGLSLGTLGFWLPVVMAPLAALPLCLWLGRLGRVEAGLTAGLLASSGIGFLVRSRVGYLDTDVWSLMLAVGAAAGFAAWLGLLRPAWGNLRRWREGQEPVALFPVLAGALALGVFCNMYSPNGTGLFGPLFGFDSLYSSGRPIIWALFGTAAVLGLALCGRGRRTAAFMGLAVFAAAWSYGWWGLAGGVAACALARWRPDAFRARGLNVGLWLALALLAWFLLTQGQGNLVKYGRLLLSYWKSSAVEQAAPRIKSLALPSVMGSIRETVDLTLAQTLNQAAGHWSVFILAMLGLAVAVWRRPAVLVFLPLLGLGLASIKMGNRFSMYACPVIGLGLGLGAADLLAWRGAARPWRWAAQGGLCVLAGLFIVAQANAFFPYPTMTRGLAEALVALKGESPQTAIVWPWWDFGYATEYYAHRDTFGDGGRHSGDWLFPLAHVLTTKSSLQAAQMMKLMGAEWAEQVREAKQAGKRPRPPAKLPFYRVSPMKGLSAMGADAAMDLVRSLARQPRDFPPSAPQYLVVAWDYLRFAGWISRFGTWDLATGTDARGRNTRLAGDVSLDARKGMLNTSRRPVPLSRMTIARADGSVQTPFWPRFGGVNVVLGELDSQTREAYVMDDTIYDSMMVRMLLDDPKVFEPQFELVVDNAPWARVYKVR